MGSEMCIRDSPTSVAQRPSSTVQHPHLQQEPHAHHAISTEMSEKLQNVETPPRPSRAKKPLTCIFPLLKICPSNKMQLFRHFRPPRPRKTATVPALPLTQAGNGHSAWPNVVRTRMRRRDWSHAKSRKPLTCTFRLKKTGSNNGFPF